MHRPGLRKLRGSIAAEMRIMELDRLAHVFLATAPGPRSTRYGQATYMYEYPAVLRTLAARLPDYGLVRHRIVWPGS